MFDWVGLFFFFCILEIHFETKNEGPKYRMSYRWRVGRENEINGPISPERPLGKPTTNTFTRRARNAIHTRTVINVNIRVYVWNVPRESVSAISAHYAARKCCPGTFLSRALVNTTACYRNEIRSESRLSPPLRSARFKVCVRPPVTRQVRRDRAPSSTPRTVIIVQLSSIDTVNPNGRRAFSNVNNIAPRAGHTAIVSRARSSSPSHSARQHGNEPHSCTRPRNVRATRVLFGATWPVIYFPRGPARRYICVPMVHTNVIL